MTVKLSKLIVVGDKLRKFRQSGDRYHVTGFVDDQIVMKKWSNGRRRWDYSCEPDYIVDEFFVRDEP